MSDPVEQKRIVDIALLHALLRAVADELYALVCEMERVGDSLSSYETSQDSLSSRRIGDLQTFDLLAQSARALSRLIREIERNLGNPDDAAEKAILLMIEDVPFHEVRQRLYSAFAGREKKGDANLSWDAGGDLDWF